MNPIYERQLALTRRTFLGSSGLSLGGMAMSLLSERWASAGDSSGERIHPALPELPHFAPRAKALIYLHMNGGPAQLDLLDYKPKLKDFFDKELPDSIRKGQRITTMTSGQTRLPVAPQPRLAGLQLRSEPHWAHRPTVVRCPVSSRDTA